MHQIDKNMLILSQSKLQMGNTRGKRIAQCKHIKMVTNISLPIEIDGGKLCESK